MKSNETVIGILAHIDAGKTTLSEQLLYRGGLTRKIGRVDNRDTCLDYYEQERRRGITVFSKQTSFRLNSGNFTLIDTPGHADFSAETERALSVLDAAILVVDGVEGVQAQTEVWWQLLKERDIPVFVFVSKNDRDEADRKAVYCDIRSKLSDSCLDFTSPDAGKQYIEDIVSLKEEWLESYLNGNRSDDVTSQAVSQRLIFPVVFGSALNGDGVDRLTEIISFCAPLNEYPDEFSALAYKMTRDSKGDRITYLKITGGVLRVKDIIGEEKINQIRIYSGEKFELVSCAEAGSACAVTGLSGIRPGDTIGASHSHITKPVIHPSLLASVTSEDTGIHTLVTLLRDLSEEMPELSVNLRKINGEETIQIGVMGKIQLEILGDIILRRYGFSVSFGQCRIMYKETIASPVMGYGHYEPLKHYAEVHLRIEPAERGSGITIKNECSLEVLDSNFQNLALTHIGEKEHIGLLTGSPLTDVIIALTAGRSHLKHTEGGDFREAVYRAVRQGLEKAESILLEPFYYYTLRVPGDCTGRALNDLQKMKCEFSAPDAEKGMVVIKGTGPVSTMLDYPQDVASYTAGKGVIIFRDAGYGECHNPEEVIESIGYEKERDLENTSSSVFCSHGAGFEVKWYDVDSMRHIK